MRLYPRANPGAALDAARAELPRVDASNARQLLAPSLTQILQCQSADGAIYWFADAARLDVWNMLEAAMGLASAGEIESAQRALDWLAQHQTPEGGWYESYALGEVLSRRQQTHHAAYVASAYLYLLHAGAPEDWVYQGLAVVEKALDFVVAQQRTGGDIAWVVYEQGDASEYALVTACASVCMSLRCGVELARHWKQQRPHWQQALDALQQELLCRESSAWLDKSDYSMDWFYPVLAGLYPQAQAAQHLREGWGRFVDENLGCRCQQSQPWITTAETCELVLALLRAGDRTRAEALFAQALRLRDQRGRLWTGYQSEDQVWWPEEQPSWTSGVAWMAADALYGFTPAGKLWRGYK